MWTRKATCNFLWGLYAFRAAGLELLGFGELGAGGSWGSVLAGEGDLGSQRYGAWRGIVGRGAGG